MKKINSGLIRTNENCIGCNKCLRTCNFQGGMVARKNKEDKNFIYVDADRCVACGACTDVCVHHARELIDDTDRFFKDLQNGKKISLLIAPSFFANYSENYGEILGGLKNLGVNKFISVGMGAEISNWAYINYIKDTKENGLISQHCPSVIGYIERYTPELIDKIIPIHSALICSAIYARNEMQINDKFAFISPCIAKKEEIDSPRGKGLVSYNVTFEKLMEYVIENDLYGDSVADEIEFGIGTFFPISGGLKENISWYLGEDIYVRQIEGEDKLYEYIEYNKHVLEMGDVPYLFFEMLNCSNGCLYGTGCEQIYVNDDNVLCNFMELHKNIKNSDYFKAQKLLSHEERVEQLNERFSNLNIDDFRCTFTDRSAKCKIKIPSVKQTESIFRKMNKQTIESKNINCAVCGYDTCTEMVTAIHNGFNHRENCIYFVREEVEQERDRTRKAEVYIELAMKDLQTGILNRNAYYEWLKEHDDFENYAVIMFDLNDLKKCNDTYGHDAGDKYIQGAVDILKTAFDNIANIYRVGGDEFCVILNNITSIDIRKALQDVKNQTEEYNKTCEYVKMQIAAGYAFYHRKIDIDFNDTQKRADKLMYSHKARLKLADKSILKKL